MLHAYCEQYGFNEQARATRLVLLGLSEADQPQAEVLHRRVISPNVGKIVDAFYRALQKGEEYASILNRYDLDHLKRTQTSYLLSLGQDFKSAEYFEERLRVGHVHARVGLRLSLYECAYVTMKQLLLDHIPDEVKAETARYRTLVSFIFKITALDMSLAIETYHLSKVRALEESLTALRMEDAELRHKVATDALTEVASHSQALAVLQQALQIAQRNNTPLCVGMVDLDLFKQINDIHGHLVGDAVLHDVAARIQSGVRNFDTVGRYGGEEFIVIFENTLLETAREIIERVRQRVAATPINVHGLELSMTLSAGIVSLRKGDDMKAMIGRADAAMYAAKAAGRDCVMVDEQKAA